MAPPFSVSTGLNYFVSFSTVDDLSYAPTDEEISRNDKQQAATGRKSWKTLRDKEGEAVWPPTMCVLRYLVRIFS